MTGRPPFRVREGRDTTMTEQQRSAPVYRAAYMATENAAGGYWTVRGPAESEWIQTDILLPLRQ